VSQTWAQIAASSPSPQGSVFAGWSTGAVIGRHLYVYETDYRSSQPGQLWRWAPSASFGGPPVASSACAANAAIINGHTAGIAMSVLLLVVITTLTTMTAQALGVVPVCGLPGCPKRAPSIGPAGFYSSSTSKSAAVNGDYVAPSENI
jgi:hypothetical protein